MISTPAVIDSDRMRFFDSEGDEIPASYVDPIYDSVRFGDGPHRPLPELTPVEAGLVIAAVQRAEESIDRGWRLMRLRREIAGWTDAEVVERTGCAPGLVPFMRHTRHGWYVEEVAALADFLGVDVIELLKEAIADEPSET